MNKNDQASIIDNLNKLIASNSLLAEANHKALSIVERSLKEKDELVSTCREIYEALGYKQQRSLAEESFFQGLNKILRK